jgi:uncharacterized membrane protein
MESELQSAGPLGWYAARPALASLIGSVGALIYAPVAGLVHADLHEYVDFPVLALPWLALIGLGVAAGIRALREEGRTRLERGVGAASLLLALGQLAGGAAFMIYNLINPCWVCI